MKANKGMYLEFMLDKTIQYSESDVDFFLRKYHTKTAMTKTRRFIYAENNFVDYFGCYMNNFFVIEAKQNNTDNFNFKRINEKQLIVLKKLNEMNILCFIVIYFVNHDEFYLIKFDYLLSKMQEDKKSIKYNFIKNECMKLELKLPGILNIKNIIKMIMESKDGE